MTPGFEWKSVRQKTDSRPPSNGTSSGYETDGAVHVTPDKLSGGGLVQKVAPEYPKKARVKKIEGTVRLWVTIDKEGKIRDVKPLSGPAELIPAAVKAVKQWRYNPFFMDGKPVTVQTDVNVNFQLDR